ncbi:MAG: M42 family metallopeptidase [Ruminococcaceae bacterium]|nr:M42 family metallopeptidase [Oscillospiraceae bacterium]
MFDLLKKLIDTPSPSGMESDMAHLIGSLCKPYADEIRIDTLGNLIVHKAGHGPKLMVAAHMDEIGLIAAFIEENGMIRFGSVGGIFSVYSLYHRVRFTNGVEGAMVCEERSEKEPKLDKCFIDIGAKNREEAEKLISTGDCAVFISEPYETKNTWFSKALDNKIGCLILIEALKKLKAPAYDVYFVFTVQEEVGLRGARTAAYGINPDYAIAVDVTSAGGTTNTEPVTVDLGKGAAIKIMDRSVICHKKMIDMLSETAKKADIPYQLEVLLAGGTDAGAIHASRAGVVTGAISVPTRYIHSPVEEVNKDDVKACIDLLAAFINE